MPIAALAIPALIGAGGSIGGALINRHGGGGSSSLFPAGTDQEALQSYWQKQNRLSENFIGRGQDMLQQGSTTLNNPLRYFSDILSGNRSSLMEALAPEVAAVNAQYQAPLREASLMGRGSALQPDLEAKRQSDISNLFFQQRPMAADKLTSIAQGLMGLGTQQMGMGGQLLQGTSRDILDYNSIIRGIQAQTRNDTPGLFGALGSSLGPILAAILGGSGRSSGSGGSGPVLTGGT